MTTQFDVFLAHNTQDKPQVRAIALALKQRNIKSWIDEEQILPGRSFQDEIQQAIPLVKSAAIFIGSQGLGHWQSWELKAFIAECVENKIPVIPVLLPGVNNLPEDLLFLKQLRWVAFSNRVDDEAAINLLAWGITGEKPDSSIQLEQKPGDMPPKIVLEEVERFSNDENLNQPIPNSKDPKQINNNDLPLSQFGGGLINADMVKAGRIGGDIYNIYQSGFSSSQTFLSQSKKELPPLLPYLANRREQESQLCEVFLKYLKQSPGYHLVCIIHGDESQCHYNFLERMRKFSLPKLLDVDPHEPIIPTYHLEWPAKLKNLHELSNQLCKNLAESILGQSLYSPEKLNKFLSNYPYPVIIHTHLLTEDLHKQGLDSLKKLLEFCHYLHQSITSQKLIIYICIKYKTKRKNHKNAPWIQWLFSFGRYFFKQYRYQKINKKVRQYLRNLSNSTLNHSQTVPVIVLPELEGINQAEVENWVRSEHTKQLIGEAMIEPLIQKVGEMFESWEEQTSSDTIPMSCLAEELSKLVKSLMSMQGEAA
ncbi:toll/interleukin-1 receptor domain-containing protein [Nostoc sp. FACHB-145]|nr:toll/interleukin-1 receptor domain-containing protein [Nostoc sp. FACHB-145]